VYGLKQSTVLQARRILGAQIHKPTTVGRFVDVSRDVLLIEVIEAGWNETRRCRAAAFIVLWQETGKIAPTKKELLNTITSPSCSYLTKASR